MRLFGSSAGSGLIITPTILTLASLLASTYWPPQVSGSQDCMVRKETGLLYPRKVWWARRITKDIYTSGRLTHRQVRYAVDAGFASVLTVWDLKDSPVIGAEAFPTAEEVRHVIQDISGLGYQVVFSVGESYTTLSQLAKFRAKFEDLPRPVLITCYTANSATFLALSSLAQRTKEGNASPSDGYPEVDATKFFYLASVLGLDFNTDKHKPLIVAVTGQEVPNYPTTPSNVSTTRRGPWWVYPIYGNWYAAGQIGSGHPSLLSDAGFKTIVNNRLGVITNGQPTQEESFLINILDDTGTYKDGGRQTVARLEATRIEPNRPNAFISVSSEVNYEASNPQEFGDYIGYNETLERLAVESVARLSVIKKLGLNYINIPIYYDVVSPAWFYEHKGELMRAANRGPVLVHCASGVRALYLAVLCAAEEHGNGLQWANRKLDDLGFTLEGIAKELYEQVLGTKHAVSGASVINQAGASVVVMAVIGTVIVRKVISLMQ